MAIAWDAESNSGATGWTGSNGTTLSWSHTCTGSNRLLIVGTYGYFTSGGPQAVTSVTYGGTNLTKINAITGTADALTQDVELWYLIAPATGSNTITITWAGAAQFASGSAASYTGTDQTSPIDSNNTGQSSGTGSGSATSLTIATTVVASNCWLVGTVAARGSQPAAGTGTTLRGLNTSSWGSNGDSNATVGTGSQSLQWTSSPSGAWPGGVVASIKPPTAAPATTAQPTGSLLLMGVGN